MVEVRGLSVVRGGRPVLERLDLDVGGGVTGLLGPSGCGKTTLIRCLVGVQRVEGGTVRVLGEPAGSRPLRDRVGYVTQQASVYDDLGVEENLRFFARVLRTPSASVDAEVDRVLTTVGLTDHRSSLVRALSGGQRSRVGLAAALLGDPGLLVLDEPTVGLDPVLRRDLWEVFHAIAGRGAAILVSSHAMDEAERCDRLLLMRKGRVIADGTPAAIRERAGAADVEGAFLRLVGEAS